MNTIEKINLILKQANISKVNLAKYLGVSRQMVYNYLDGDDLSKLPNEKCQLLLKLLDVKYRIPNTNKLEAAGKTNMVSGAEWLFSLMQKDAGLQNLEQVMRYILGKYAHKDYGVSSLDFNIFNIRDFSTVSGIGSLKAFIRYFEGTKEENRTICCI